GSGIGNGTEAVAAIRLPKSFCRDHLGAKPHERRDLIRRGIGRKILEADIFPLGDDQHMAWRLWRYIAKRQRVVVLGNGIVRNFTPEDAGEDVLVVVVESHGIPA